MRTYKTWWSVLTWAAISFSPLVSSAVSVNEANELKVTALLSGQYFQSGRVDISLVGTNLDLVAAIAVVMDTDKANPVTPSELEKLAESEWVPFQPELKLDLGNEEGERILWFGFKSVSGQLRWERHSVFIDRSPPGISITNPQSGTVSEPIIQIIGVSDEDLISISYDLTNSKGQILGQRGAVTRHLHDPALRKSRGTQFQCYDVNLMPGTNYVTLHCVDRSHNELTTNLTYILDLSQDKTAPEISIHFPGPDAEINGKVIKLMRGRLSEPCAKIEVSGTSERPIVGIVERDGLFWIENVPLPNDENSLTVTATDAAGNSSTKTILVKRSNVEILFDPLPEPAQRTKIPTLSGTVSDPNCTIWVNGVKATMKGKQWIVKDIPINRESGTAVYEAVAIPNSVNGGNGYRGSRAPKLEDMGNPKLRPQQ